MLRSLMYERWRSFRIECMFSRVFRHQTSCHLQIGVGPMQEQVAGLYMESNRAIRACIAYPRSTIPITILVFFSMQIRKTASQCAVEKVRIIHVYQRISLCCSKPRRLY